MAVYYVASKLSFVACKTRCIGDRRRKKSTGGTTQSEYNQDDETIWNGKEVSVLKRLLLQLKVMLRVNLINPFLWILGTADEIFIKELHKVNKVDQLLL